MKGVIVCSVTLREVFEVIHEAFTIMSEQAKEFNDLIKEALVYEEELEYKERISFPYTVVVKVLKSQVLDRKPRCIRARTVC
ncbi:TPA: hypothetical protein ACR3Z0_006116 [Bacillus thuringiensis]|uniref:Uncharacterized protein n=1 Tax=Bacillus thuringiensis TaxID=1428 RepID=A0A9X6Q8R0_BACTU|nr:MULTISPECIES: hypothetical protein [Bacillus cereus group]AQY37898.1 hypothetical protein B4918_07690 [Bacillus thuringiensis]ETE89061.1 hypothetical protein C621_0226455 [Bacillus thuringiensis serovar aizawai str. Leapi01]ETE96318.1 hypothetical protein C623_0219990 [Bacillus thuringiensis serovar aizawai str. Hu4-2]KAB1374285.1 hypothetical protein FPG93_28370 [Bacillus thuringiensis]KLA33490.1 hypothetical protein B4158_5965 [Bacillus cereus]